MHEKAETCSQFEKIKGIRDNIDVIDCPSVYMFNE